MPRSAAKREADRRYRHSAKGRAASLRYSRSAKGRARDRRCAARHLERIRARGRRFSRSAQGRARDHRYHQTARFKEHNRWRSRANTTKRRIQHLKGEG
jgi:hypothetical protein